MSILLDAVTRAKQQEMGEQLDPVLTPRAQYRRQSSASRYLTPLAVLVAAVLAGGALAWGWHSLDTNKKPLAPETSSVGGQASQQQARQQDESQGYKQPTQAAEVVEQGATEVRLAGKVALPMAQPIPQTQAVQSRTIQSQNTRPQNAQAENRTTINQSSVNQGSINQSGEAEIAARQSPASVNAQSTGSDLLAASVAEAAKELQFAQLQADGSATVNQAQEMPAADDEPIILGANPNRRGLEVLESLKRQVNEAAEDVGLSSAESRRQDELVAQFQAALADVEHRHSAEKPVSPPELDPIPKAEEEVPPYGGLPAGLQLQVPEFEISAHVYASEPSKRWLNVEGAELQEGDSIKGQLKIVEIRPRDVVLEIQGQKFRVPAI
ncbi:general secretion pathway protein GspB [Shewanella algae]|uniref:General secretion pathway protein GspB n=1 Tax=Shewanella algae TaxID=38313 RepID=A0AAD1NP95_9GAMM|nr:general secretion pathway protein GspB [Shewanella algae]MBO2596255.1 general secretion pathway protein GspB [Shewanella algae]MBO2667612.1 general secretion pathway protein GspB [Shewanella algae]BCV46099.1 general secretion pathway protein GspB [Shewanella algae]